jgi:hypothetical protein
MPTSLRDRPRRAARLALGLLLAGCGASGPRMAPSGAAGQAGTTASGGAGGGAGACPTADGTLARVASIVTPKCATANCHDPITLQSGMDLSTAEMIHHSWVGVHGLDQCTDKPVLRVLPGNPDGSFVMAKISGQGVTCARATRMPPPPADALSACEIETVRAWIAAGAPAEPAPADGGTDGGLDDGAVDGPDDGSADAPDVDPTACTSTQGCDPISEICVEVQPTSTSDNCFTYWQCFTHDLDEDVEAHACPPEVVTFCGCDGNEYRASWSCPGHPYDHIGSCSDGSSCDANRVRCTDAAPACPAGQVPAVIAGCWGPCVPITSCRCDQNWQCPQRDVYRCVTYPDFRCEPIPPPNDGGADAPSDGGADAPD